MRAVEAIVEEMPEVGVTVISKWIFNCYVVHDGGEGRPFVVDAGVPSMLFDIERVLRRLGFAPGDLTAVAATHAHADHVCAMPGLRDVGAPVLTLPHKVKAYVDGEKPRSPGPREVARILPVLRDQPFDVAPLRELASASKRDGFDARGCRLSFTPTSWLADGDPIPGAPDFVTLHTPGHTDDELCFWSQRRRILLSGDAVLALGRRGWFNPEFVDKKLSEKTEARLRDLAVDVLLPGHGRAVAAGSSPGGVWADALGHDHRPRSELAHRIRRVFRSHR